MRGRRILLYSLIFILSVCSFSRGAFFPQNNSPSANFEKEKIHISPPLPKGDSGGLSGGKEKDIIDIKPLEKIERDYRKILLISAIAIILICLILLGYYFYKKRKKKSETPMFIPPHELALKEFNQLKGRMFLENGYYRQYYFEFSEIFRKYLERRFSIPATERTSEEIIPVLQKIGVVKENQFLLGRDFLLVTDLVKFAKHFPLQEEIERIEKGFIKFVEGTKEETELVIQNSKIKN